MHVVASPALEYLLHGFCASAFQAQISACLRVTTLIMAFRRTSADLPKDVEFPADLAKLGFKVNADGRIVEIHNAKEFFKFEKYDKYDTNQRRYSAMHQAVRAKAHKILASMGIAPVYIDLTDDMKSHHVGGKKPVAPSMKILASPGFSQFDDKELYLIVGDSKQDLGIWSRKTVLTEGGIEHGRSAPWHRTALQGRKFTASQGQGI
jgi:hypothetical protein